MSSLFERIGGEPAIMAAVQRFYLKVMADELLRPFFGAIDMESQSKKQVAFMAWAFGGPEKYKGRDLREAHAPLLAKGLGDAHFDRVAKHLGDTLAELGVDAATAAEALALVESQRGHVLGRA